ncbi:MAG: metal-sensitive transcriptional regulator [Firmicutes bacterium]|nr:metal-sensitive transcriptional regulator [Bacillota bacterium]
MKHPVASDARKNIYNRLRRIEGQARGIQRMVEEGKDCTQIITQLTALQAAVKNVSKLVLSNYLECCIEEEMSRSGDYRAAIRRLSEILIQAKL